MTHLKAARISPDSAPIAYGAAGLAGAIYLGAFLTSFFGQASLAAHMQIPHPLQYVVPAVIDFGLVLFALATLVRKARGESTAYTNVALGFWTLISIAANVGHVLIPAGPQATWSAGIYAGAALSALMPLAALGASLVLEHVLIAPPSARPAHNELIQGEVEPLLAAKPARGAPSAQLEQAEPTPLPAVSPVGSTNPPAAISSHGRAQPAPAPTSYPAATAAPLAAPRPLQGRKPVEASQAHWETLSKSERADLVQSLQDEGLSLKKISDRIGASLSSVKRAKAEPEVRELQLV